MPCTHLIPSLCVRSGRKSVVERVLGISFDVQSLGNISLGGHQHNEGKGYHASNWSERESLTLVDLVGGRPDTIIREEDAWQCQENPWNSKK